ncbi:MAG: threonine--tRNA ligase [Candidatus Woesearchaeota archaeon]
MEIELPDGSVKEYENGKTPLDIAKDISEGLARATLAAKVDDKVIDATTPLTTDCKVQLLTFDDEEGKRVFWHSSTHVLAQAVKELWPHVKLTIGPAIEGGFYYDFDTKEPFTPEDLKTIEEKMKEIANRKIEFKREDVTKEKAKEYMKARDETYKVEMIDDKVSDGEMTSVYHQDDFVDFCLGPHVPDTGMIKAFMLTKIAGAYWKGDSSNKMLQRIYGVSFPDKKRLKEYKTLLEEAEKRDHRKLGKQLDMFSFHEEASGMPFFHDKGEFVRNQLLRFVESILIREDYQIVKAPIILNEDLWKRSGHWNHYQDNMYFTKIDDFNCAVKPMNCPGHMLIYGNGMHSYKDLPIRMAEFGLVHRHELSGVLSGLFRVRAFTQDDAHIFCTEDQMKNEIVLLIKFMHEVYSTFGFEYQVELSTKPEKAMGDPKLWEKAENILKEVLEEQSIDYKLNEGDGAFYGPKIDFHLKDAIGRTWQCGTIQLDFQMPEKFELTYEGNDGKKHQPIMLHRAVLGSAERFMGILIEHYAGKFPLWLNPNQVKILTVADRHKEYAQGLMDKMDDSGLRVVLDDRAESIPKKVRNAQLERFNYILVVGDNEQDDGTVTVRTRDGNVEGAHKSDDFLERLLKEVKEKR